MTRRVSPLLLWAIAGCGEDTGARPDAGPFSREPDLEEMVLVPAGTFSMGHPVEPPGAYGQPWKENELPAHDVSLAAYRIDRSEVTVAEYAAFLTAAGGEAHWHPLQPVLGAGARFEPREGMAARPIALVSWYDAVTFCAWTGKRLPTEAEWERAARGPGGRTYPWGEDPPDCARAVFYTGASRCEDQPTDVGSKSPDGDSAEGLWDLAGNVAEWTADLYACYPENPQQEPVCPAPGETRVVRGGGFHEAPSSLRGTARWAADPQDRSVGVGFRCAL